MDSGILGDDKRCNSIATCNWTAYNPALKSDYDYNYCREHGEYWMRIWGGMVTRSRLVDIPDNGQCVHYE